MKHYILTFTSTLLTAFGTASIGLATDRDTVGTDFGYVGAWRGHPKGSEGIGVGTAELIAPDWVITAKHVATKAIANPSLARVVVHFETPAGKFTARVIEAYGAPDADIALARLDRPLREIPVIALAENPPPADRLVRITMIGHSGDKHALYDRYCRLKSRNLARVDRGETTQLKAGDSGGAWISGGTNTNDAVLIGVVHGGGLAPEVSRLRRWIDETLAMHGGAKATWRKVDYAQRTAPAAGAEKNATGADESIQITGSAD